MKNAVKEEVSKHPKRSAIMWLFCLVLLTYISEGGLDKIDGIAIAMLIYTGVIIAEVYWDKDERQVVIDYAKLLLSPTGSFVPQSSQLDYIML